MASDRALVGNAADKEQVRRAGRKVRDQRAEELADLRAVLRLPEGRRVLTRWIDRLRPQDRLWEPSALLQYKAGQHDVAVMLLNEIDEADPDAQLVMRTEARGRQKREAREAASPPTPPDTDVPAEDDA